MSLHREQKAERVYYLDLARVVAIVSISMNHAVNFTYDNYDNQFAEFMAISSLATCIKTVAYIFSRLGVPLFLMITGALVLNKSMNTGADIKRFYKHNVMGLLVTTEIWFVIAYCFTAIYNVRGIEDVLSGLILLVKEMLFIEVVPLSSTWYMPMILGLYTTIPLVILAKQNAEKSVRKWFLIPLILVFIQSMLIPALSSFYFLLTSTDNSASIMSFVMYGTDTIFHNIVMYYIYVVIGYCIHHGSLSKMKDLQLISWTIVVFAACCVYQFWAYSRPVNYLIDYNFPVLPVCAGLLFELIRRKAYLLNKISKPVTYVSRAAFAIYFLHMIIMTAEVELMSFGGWRMDEKMLFLEISALIISLLIIMPLSKISLFRKYVFMIK